MNVREFDAERLARACYFILDEIEKISGHSAILGEMRGTVTGLREREKANALALMLKELLQWTEALPKQTREGVKQGVKALGLSGFQTVDARRVKRVLDRGTIRTTSEYRAVQEFVDKSLERAADPEAFDKLEAMLVDFGVRKQGGIK